MDNDDGLPFFDLLRNGDHILLPFSNVSTILLRKTSSRESIKPPENPFLVSSYSVIKFLVSGNHHSPITIYHSPFTITSSNKKIRTFILPVASQPYFHFTAPHQKSTLLCSVLLWEKTPPRTAAWSNGCEDYPGHS